MNSIRNKPIFGKLRGKIIDELAVKMLTDQLFENDDGIPIPQSWVHEAEHLKMELCEAVADENEMEQRTGYDKTKVR